MLSFSTFAVSAALLSTSVQTLYRRLGCSCRKAREQTYQHAQRIKIGKTDWHTYLLLHVVKSIELFFCLSRWFLCIRLPIYCVALSGFAFFIHMNTFQVAACLCSHPANRIWFTVLPRYFFVLKITSRWKPKQLPWLAWRGRKLNSICQKKWLLLLIRYFIVLLAKLL